MNNPCLKYSIFDNENDDALIRKVYETTENFYVENVSSDGDVYIFFSSHGLYFPTTIDEFKKQVVQGDKYEWVNISKNEQLRAKASKFIFIRDIYKNWCLHGINSRCNSLHDLATLLTKYTEGKNIITVGSSAGGYMAIALGCMLNAKTIFAFSPQISLDKYNEFHPVKYLDYYHSDNRFSAFMSLVPFIENYKGQLYYYYPTECAEDVAQFDAVKDIRNPQFNVFAVRFSNHGTPIYGESVIKSLIAPENVLKALCAKYDRRTISRERYLADTSGLHRALIRIVGSKVKTLLRRKSL